jgi:SAM-dependent methyltransferase
VSAAEPLKRRLRRRASSAYVRARLGVEGLIFERRYGLQTAGTVHLEEFGLASEGRLHYQPSEWRTLHRILRPDEVDPSDVFIDFGSGMGRAVFEAAQYPFKRVIGVEVASQLNDIARQNVERNRHRFRSGEVDLITADATSFDIPDDVSVVYISNPFQGQVFRSVVDNVLASVDRCPRRVRLIYVYPTERGILDATGRFRLIRRGRAVLRWWRRLDTLLMYEVLPSSDH